MRSGKTRCAPGGGSANRVGSPCIGMMVEVAAEADREMVWLSDNIALIFMRLQ